MMLRGLLEAMMKRYSQLLTNEERELLINYIIEKINVFKKIKKEIENEDTSKMDSSLLKDRRAIIRQCGHDISYFINLETKLRTDGMARKSDALELWCMADNKEQYDKIHNDLHITIVNKLKEYQFKSK